MKLCEKFKIPYPLDPDGEIVLLPGNTAALLEMLPDIPSVIIKPKKVGGTLYYGPDKSSHIAVTIDLNMPERDIKNDISGIYKKFSPSAQKGSRDRKDELDIWEIYDLVNCGKNLLQVTKSLFELKENPAYSNKADRKYKQVERACKKATELIKKFES